MGKKDISDRMKVSANLIFPVEQSSNLGCMAESVDNITQLITVRISYVTIYAVIPHIFYLFIQESGSKVDNILVLFFIQIYSLT